MISHRHARYKQRVVHARRSRNTIDLPNLLRGFYRLDMFLAGAFPWEFSDEPSLLNVLTGTTGLLIDYGIRWLEDPASNLDWVKQPLLRK